MLLQLPASENQLENSGFVITANLLLSVLQNEKYISISSSEL